MTGTVYGPARLAEEIARFQPGDRDSASGRRSEILVKADDLRVLLVTMRAGTTLAEHNAPGTVSIQVIEGEMDIIAGGTTYDLAAGGIISLAAGVRHAVRARTDGAFLLTIAWSGQSAG